MADRADHIAGFQAIAARLVDAAAASAGALATHRGTPVGADLERHLEHTLDRLSVLYARGTFDGHAVSALIESAIARELRLAHDAGDADAEARAHALLDVARRGHRVHVRGVAPGPVLRGVHVASPRAELVTALHAEREPYVPWRGGILVVLDEPVIAGLRAAGDAVDVLYLDPDELLELDSHPDRAVFDAEIERRLAAAQAAPDRVGDDRAGYLRRTLLAQTRLLRHLRDRLAAEHPAAHRALLPVLADHRATLERALVAAPAALAAAADPLAAAIDHERALQALITQWSAEPDVAGLRDRIVAVAGVTLLAALERHRP